MRITVRRDALLEDALHALKGVGSSVKGPMHVSFVSQHGGLEAGIDQGGLLKEFLEEASTLCVAVWMIYAIYVLVLQDFEVTSWLHSILICQLCAAPQRISLASVCCIVSSHLHQSCR